MVQLDVRQITELLDAAIDAGLDRDALNAALNKQYSSSLPLVSDRKQQILLDLVQHSDAGTLTDGTVPLQQWLETARSLADPRPAVRVFRKYLDITSGLAIPGSPRPSVWMRLRAFVRPRMGRIRVFALGAALGGGAVFLVLRGAPPVIDREAFRDCRDRLVRVSAISAKPTTDVDSLKRTVQMEVPVCLSTLHKGLAQ